MNDSVVTERGQVSLPAGLRKQMGIVPGQRLHWEQISAREIRVTVPADDPPGPMAALGYARVIRPGSKARTTRAWLNDLREGEQT